MLESRLLRPSMRAVIYSRVSTDAQERAGTSLDTQERACREYAQAKGWVVAESIKDTASGANLDRPGIERVRQLLRQGFVDVVLAYAVDRLSRSQIHIAVLLDDIEKADATLEFVTEDFENTPVGRLILNVRAFAGEVEREKIAERTMRGKLERARCKGRRDNVPPGRSSAEVWRLKTVPPVAFNQERRNLIEGGLDVQSGDVPACSQSLLRRRDERSGGCAGIRAAPGHGAQDAQVLGASGVSTGTTGWSTEARPI